MNHRCVLQWDAMLTMIWSTNVYSDVAGLAVCCPSPEQSKIVAGNLVSSQVVVGDVRTRSRTEEGLEVAAMIAGRAPLTLSQSGDLLVCCSAADNSVTAHRSDRTWELTCRAQCPILGGLVDINS